MKKRLIEGYWDCKYCGSQKIRGGLRECPNCGKPRDEDTTFYLSGTHNYVPFEKAVTINKNPDLVCTYCHSLNSDNNKTCSSCGAPRTSENMNYFQNKEKQIQKSHEYSEPQMDSSRILGDLKSVFIELK